MGEGKRLGPVNGGQVVSSAEITATYRCAYPKISGDELSKYLVSPAGIERARAFIDKYDYALAPLKISLCAGYFLRETTLLLSTGKYDSCISFASGFSLLTYLIAEKNKAILNIQYFDTDLPHMVEARNSRISNIDAALIDTSVLERMQSQVFDIQQAYEEGLSLKDLFPTCKNPIFILDGVSYFLSPGCVEWIIRQMSAYTQSAVTMYYWPDDMLRNSTLFHRVFQDLNKGMILEKLKSFWGEDDLDKFTSCFPFTHVLDLSEVEESFVPTTEIKLTNPNTFFPIRVITGEKGEETLRNTNGSY